MSDYRKQIKQHQDEIERLNKQLPTLQQAAKDALAIFNNGRVNRSAYPHEETGALSSAKSAIDEHRQNIAHLVKLADWEEGHKQAPAAIKSARKAMDVAESEGLALKGKRDQVAEKLARLRGAQRKELEGAETKEQEAAAQYAAALTAGDDSAESRAESALQAASEALNSLKRGRSGVTAVAQTLASELEKLDERLGDASQQQEQARLDLLRAARYLWAGRLEQAAREVTRIAAHVAAAEKALGWHSSMDDIHLPLLAPTGPSYLDKRYIREVSAGLGIEQLTAG